MAQAFIALGSNLGDSRAVLQSALSDLNRLGVLLKKSSVYKTAPIGGPKQGDFLNMVCLIETPLEPVDLLDKLHEIEKRHARQRNEPAGPRTLDLDIILYDQVVMEEPNLTLPHPRSQQRRFVLEPLAEIAPLACFPDGRSAAETLNTVLDQKVKKLMEPQQEPTPNKRGVWWVAGQLVLFFAISRTSLGAIWPVGNQYTRSIGWVLAVVGGLIVLLSMLNLSTSLTAFPKPMPGARLVDKGAYGVVRHPIYGALIVGAIGLSLARGSGLALLLSIGLLGYFTLKAKHEETMLLAAYPEYEEYMERVTRRFVPYVI